MIILFYWYFFSDNLSYTERPFLQKMEFQVPFSGQTDVRQNDKCDCKSFLVIVLMHPDMDTALSRTHYMLGICRDVVDYEEI